MAKKRRSSFKGKVAANAHKQRVAGSSYGYLNLPRGVPIYSAKPGGRVWFDIMPYTVTDPNHPDRDDELGIALPGELWYKRPFKIHRNIGADNETVVCLTSVGKKCPICEYRTKQIREGADKEITDALKTSLRNLYVIIPKKDREHEEKPHIWDISQYLFQDLLTDELEENEEYEVFPDLEEGLTLRVRFDSSTIGGSKPFAEANRIDFEEREAPYPESILDDVPNLDEVLQVLSTAQLERKFFEMEEPDDVPDPEIPDEEEEEKETPKEEKQPRKRHRKEPEPEPEEDMEMDEEEEEEVDPDACVACKGTGKDSRGKTCRICHGTGKKKKQESKSDDKCPHGYKFGIDTEDHDECFDCDLWDECMDVKEANE